MEAEHTVRKLVVFCGGPAPPSTVEAVEAVAEAYPHWRIFIVQGNRRRVGTWPYLKGKLRRLLRQPVSYPLELACQLSAKLRPRRRRKLGGRVRLPALDEIGQGNVEFFTTECIHDRQAVEKVRRFDPWLGLSLAAPILDPVLFEVPELGTINVHKSLLPDYRGMPPGFWELHDRAEQTGVSIHGVSESLDAGDIVEQRAIPISPYATPGSLGPLLDVAAAELLLAVLKRLDAGEQPRMSQGRPETPTRSRPAWLVARRLRRRLVRRRLGRIGIFGLLRGAAKTLVLSAYVYLWSPVRNLACRFSGRAHTTVLLYHRVSDDLLDSITIGVEQFRQHLKLLRRSYDILDLQEFLDTRSKPRRRPAVVLTFDDGYQSNYLAAVLMRREGIPATFFLSTGIVGSDRAFPHDAEKLGRRVPALSWQQVRQMARWGFRFGIHTAGHVNVGRVPLDEAETEVRTAMADLRAQLGPAASDRWFAYPHGKRSDITEQVRERLADSGIECCLSAYGGTNRPKFDPLDVRRQGVDCRFSLLALRAAVEGWQARPQSDGS
ncbi:MAG TPA: polysaccharide deacetylase family protein [Phycisphaerae bacterium]|nr:polysaccharide deacetylase family protein [Phycisphaerae bacterium]